MDSDADLITDPSQQVGSKKCPAGMRMTTGFQMVAEYCGMITETD